MLHFNIKHTFVISKVKIAKVLKIELNLTWYKLKIDIYLVVKLTISLN